MDIEPPTTPRLKLWPDVIDTNISIIEERGSSNEEVRVKNVLLNLRPPVIIGLLFVLPFMILEFMFQIAGNPAAQNAKNLTGLTVLFCLMWLLSAVFIAMLMPLLRVVRAGGNLLANPIVPLLRLAFLTLIAIAWGGLVIDQLPCFLGVPNCD